jgi:hypothetical protein
MADDPRVESGPLPADKPHGQEVSNTLQVYLLIFTLVFVLILGKLCSAVFYSNVNFPLPLALMISTQI